MNRLLISSVPKASLCGHYEVVRLLLESGALCERDTFQGERCLYNALNDRIRNLLLSYDYSKTRDPLQPLAGHITSLLSRKTPETSDITLVTNDQSFHLHKFILSARSPYFARKLSKAPETILWRVPQSVPSRSLEMVITGLYFGEVKADFTASEDDRLVLAGIERLGRQLEITNIFEMILESDRRLARQRRTDEVQRGRDQLEAWFRRHVLAHAVRVDRNKVDGVRWDRQNSIFADVLLCANEGEDDAETNDRSLLAADEPTETPARNTPGLLNNIPVGPTNPSAAPSSSSQIQPNPTQHNQESTLYPAHRAMLLRSDYFQAMFTSSFHEAHAAQHHAHLPIIRVDCTPAVLSIILTYIYTESTSNIPLSLALPLLFTADALFIEPLKTKAALIISTLGNGATSAVESTNPRGDTDLEEAVDIYDIVRAGWDTRVHRLEEFGARYLAYRLERHIESFEFKELVRESAARIKGRQETDTVELVDDIRYYLSERYRLRFEDLGLQEAGDGNGDKDEDVRARENNGTFEGRDERGALKEGDDGKEAPDASGVGVIRTLEGDIAGDEFAQDALNYQILLGKIDKLLDELKLDA